MGKALVFGFLLAVAGVLEAQTPQATFEYRGTGCGWFSYLGQDLVVSQPPRIGQYVEFRTSIPPYGVDMLQFGSFDPRFPVGNGCSVYAFAFPGPVRVWIPFQTFQRFSIPNDPALAGYTIHVQQLNSGWSTGWEMSRGVRLRLGY